MGNYFRSWKRNVQQGGLDFMGKYPTFEEAIKHGDFCDYIDNNCHVHNVLDNGHICMMTDHIDYLPNR